MEIKKIGVRVLSFCTRNLLSLVVLLGLTYWFFPDVDGPIVFERSQKGYSRHMMASNDMAMEMDEAAYAPMAKMSRSGRGGGIVPPVFAGDFDPDQTDKKVVKNANLTIEVKDTEKAKDLAEEKIKEFEGGVTHMNSWENRPGVLSYNMTIRVPSEKLEGMIGVLEGFGVKKSENFSVQDITAAYFDTENQLANLSVRRDRLRELMERETESLKDVLEIDRELNNVQNQIDRLERTQKRRDTDVAYSTLQLTIQPEPEIGDISNPHWSAGRSWKQSVNDLINASQGIFDRTIKLIVFMPLWLPLLVLVWWGRKKIVSS